MNNLILGLLGFLIFILNINGTIALRNMLAVLLLIVLIYAVKKHYNKAKYFFDFDLFKVVLPLIILTIYIFFHTIYISQDFDWSLSDFKSNWIYPIIYFVIGVLLAYLSKLHFINHKSLLTIVFLALFLHIFYLDLIALDEFIQTKTLISRHGGFTNSPVLVNYITNILLAMTLSEAICRAKFDKYILQISDKLLFIIFMLILFSSIVEGMRFGVISILFIGLSSITLFLIKNKNFSHKFKIIIVLVFSVMITLPFIYNLQNDERWSSLIETINISLDTENNKFWIDGKNIPKLSNGEDVSSSNYERMAWATKSFEYIKKEPMGIGFGRNSFGHMIEKYENYPDARGKHSHSSILDFTMGVGIIGLIIWLYFIFYLMLTSLKLFIKNGNYYALMGFFTTSGFFFRSLVDSNMRDHMFLQFMLMLGIFISLMTYEKNKLNSSQ